MSMQKALHQPSKNCLHFNASSSSQSDFQISAEMNQNQEQPVNTTNKDNITKLRQIIFNESQALFSESKPRKPNILRSSYQSKITLNQTPSNQQQVIAVELTGSSKKETVNISNESSMVPNLSADSSGQQQRLERKNSISDDKINEDSLKDLSSVHDAQQSFNIVLDQSCSDLQHQTKTQGLYKTGVQSNFVQFNSLKIAKKAASPQINPYQLVQIKKKKKQLMNSP